MSLRLRLLLAVGAIAIVALVVADFATYSALRTSLYNQVDQQLAQQPQPPRADAERPGRPAPLAQPSGVAGGGRRHTADGEHREQRAVGGAGGTGGFPNIFGISYFAVVTPRAVHGRQRSGVPGLRRRPRVPPRSCPSPSPGSPPSPTGHRSRTSPPGPIAPGGPSLPGPAPRSSARRRSCRCRRSRSSTRTAPCTRSS